MVRVNGLVRAVANGMSPFRAPSLEQVKSAMRLAFAGAEDYAESFIGTMSNQGWRDRSGKPIQDWRRMAREYANKAARNARGVANA